MARGRGRRQYELFVAERDGRIVGQSCSTAGRPTCACRADSIDLAQASTDPEARGTGVGRALTAHVIRWAHENGYPVMTTDWRMTNLWASRFWPKRGFRGRSCGCTGRSRSAAGPAALRHAPDRRRRARRAVVLRPPPPGEPVADVRAAVRDALRFPLAGDPLEALVTRGGRATIVVEPPALPLPGR